jgi:hypothetical protein
MILAFGVRCAHGWIGTLMTIWTASLALGGKIDPGTVVHGNKGKHEKADEGSMRCLGSLFIKIAWQLGCILFIHCAS